MGKEYKTSTIKLDVKTLTEDEDKYLFEGYASTFNNVDSGFDRILPGAFTKTIKNRNKSIKVMRDHYTLIGVIESAIEDEKGLFVKGKISKTATGMDTYLLMKDGAITDMSIGYVVIESNYITEDKKEIREIKEVELYEISVTPWGMNSQAEITDVKSRDADTIASLEKRIDTLEANIKEWKLNNNDNDDDNNDGDTLAAELLKAAYNLNQ